MAKEKEPSKSKAPAKKSKSRALVKAPAKKRPSKAKGTYNGGFPRVRINERRFFDAYIGEAGFVGWRAYKIVNPHVTDESARAHAPEIVRRIQPMIERWLDEVGLSDVALKTKLVKLLDAKEKRFFPYLKGDEQVITEVEVEALAIQARMLELSMKARGMLSEKSSREIRQIDELIAIELAKLAMAGQGFDFGSTAEDEHRDVIEAEVEA